MEEESKMRINCPACSEKNSAFSIIKEMEIPHFGNVIETSIICENCGFKHTDIISLEQNDPAKYILKINKDTLNSRVIRSQSATVSIPELGLKVEPGPKSEGYVTNVEGIIVRFEGAIKKAINLFCSEESQKNAEKRLLELEKLVNGEIPGTLIIEDPFGQSNIIDSNVEVIPLTEEEVKNLNTGFNIIENKKDEK